MSSTSDPARKTPRKAVCLIARLSWVDRAQEKERQGFASRALFKIFDAAEFWRLSAAITCNAKQNEQMPRRKKLYTTTVPKGCGKLIAKLQENGEITNEQADKLARLLSWLMLATSVTKERRRHRHWVPLCSEKLRAMFGGGYLEVVVPGLKAGLLERNDSFSTGGWYLAGSELLYCESFTKSVRLGNGYCMGRFEEWTLGKKPRDKGPRKETKLLGVVETWLCGKLERFTLPDLLRGDNLWSEYAIRQFRNGRNLYAATCDYGRFHTNVTSLSRGARSHLMVESGDSLSMLDIKNGQPLILGLALVNQIDSTGGPGLASDVRRWTKLCEPGGCYEWLLNEVLERQMAPYWVNIPENRFVVGNEKVVTKARSFEVKPTEWTRDDVKKAFLVILFAPVDMMVKSPLYTVMRECFPYLTKEIVGVKTGGHQRLAQICQKFESDLMIREVGGLLMQHLPDVPCQPIHDAWIIPTKFADKCREMIEGVYAQLAVEPSIDVQSLAPEERERATYGVRCVCVVLPLCFLFVLECF